MSLRRRLRRLLLAVGASLAVVVAALPVAAVETPPGSKNFTPPRNVPNYFSNESGPFNGGAGARTAQPGPVPVYATIAQDDEPGSFRRSCLYFFLQPHQGSLGFLGSFFHCEVEGDFLA
jgi:hypothetical protein